MDAWSLDDGEALSSQFPDTFEIPPSGARTALYPGDICKLVFRIRLESGEAVERMWVVVRERLNDCYLGVLDNDPQCLSENDRLWSGVELAFEPRHIIAIDLPTDATMAVARGTVRTPWV